MNIFKLIVIIAIIYVAYKVVKMFQRRNYDSVRPLPKDENPARGEDLVQDPFCKTYVPKSQAYVQVVDGQDKYFCSRECCEKYITEKK